MNSPQACRQTHRHLLCRVPENPTAVSDPCAHAPLFLSSILPQRLKRFNIINCKKQCREFFGWRRRDQLTPEAREAFYPNSFPCAGENIGADDSVCPPVRIHRTASFAARPQPCLRRLVLTNSTFLAPPQAAGLVRSVARPLQIANASLVCNLVPSVLPEKVGKKRRWRTIYGAYAQMLFSALFGRKTVTFPIAFSSILFTGL